ncbi:hypothetical protein P167DRAFT_488831 [Morchella conica CCBAS932]|uniref:Cyclin N-terminal domain-containing protein n=2 Tax=Morchella sect. Distantes TaxID=1051054 RepID=A0A3N4KQM1_9PEZI|nr:hypothetical protein P167DRAFT_488831 [Morchella conica CCBAS932]
MSRRNTHSLVLVLPSYHSICSSPPSSSSSSSPSSSPSFSTANPPAQCPAPCTRPPPFPVFADHPATAGHKFVSRSLPCLPTVHKLGLVTPDTPVFPFHATQDSHISGEKMSMCQEASTDNMMECHIPTPNLTNSPGSPGSLDLDLDCSFEEFERYLPLSNLPTPPPSDSSPKMLVEVDFEEELNPELFGPATYLCSMIPRNASREAPSAYLLQSILQRANISLETVGLGSCILDCLSSRFVRRWREEWCAETGSVEGCEVLAVAALSIALKFLEDTSFSVRMWARDIAGDLFSSRLLNKTEMLILDDINFSVASICTTELIEYSLAEMRRCAQAAPQVQKSKVNSPPSKSLARTTFPRLSQALEPVIGDDIFEPLHEMEGLAIR